MNTRIDYLYRDGSNYKVPNTAILQGEMTPAQEAAIIACLDCEEYFIPSQVGLPEKRFSKWDEQDDHAWFEWQRCEPTAASPTVAMTADDLVRRFAERKGRWDVDAALSALFDEPDRSDPPAADAGKTPDADISPRVYDMPAVIVPTPDGDIVAYDKRDSEYPGVMIDLVRPGEQSIGLAMVEYITGGEGISGYDPQHPELAAMEEAEVPPERRRLDEDGREECTAGIVTRSWPNETADVDFHKRTFHCGYGGALKAPAYDHGTWMTVEVQERELLSVSFHHSMESAIDYANDLLREQVRDKEDFDATVARREYGGVDWELAHEESLCAWCNDGDNWDCFIWKL